MVLPATTGVNPAFRTLPGLVPHPHVAGRLLGKFPEQHWQIGEFGPGRAEHLLNELVIVVAGWPLLGQRQVRLGPMSMDRSMETHSRIDARPIATRRPAPGTRLSGWFRSVERQCVASVRDWGRSNSGWCRADAVGSALREASRELRGTLFLDPNSTAHEVPLKVSVRMTLVLRSFRLVALDPVFVLDSGIVQDDLKCGEPVSIGATGILGDC